MSVPRSCMWMLLSYTYWLSVSLLYVLRIFADQSMPDISTILTHWGRETHICVSKLTIIGSDNGLSPDPASILSRPQCVNSQTFRLATFKDVFEVFCDFNECVSFTSSDIFLSIDISLQRIYFYSFILFFIFFWSIHYFTYMFWKFVNYTYKFTWYLPGRWVK